MAPYRIVQALSSLALLQAATAEFTVNCAPLTIQRGDPIVFPGQISPHVHIVTGGTAFQFSQPNEVAVGAKATTCDKILDNSNYWQPQLYHQRRDGKFELVHMQGNVSFPTSSRWSHKGKATEPLTTTRPHTTCPVLATMNLDDRTATMLRLLSRHQLACEWLLVILSARIWTKAISSTALSITSV